MPSTSEDQRLDAVCLGETMMLLSPVSGTPLDQRPSLSMEVGGAESNVACALAQLGHRVAWLGRVGEDPFGRAVTSAVASYGVDVDGVEVDRTRRTGVYFKDPSPGGTSVYYYRAGSAAAGMDPDFAAGVADRARLLHLSGITPALSSGCAALTERLVRSAPAGSSTVSFDVNYRPGLWSRGVAAETLLPLARAADVVFVGRDEAETLWGTATPDLVRTLMPDVTCLVVKDADNEAVCYEGDTVTVVPAPPVEVVEPVGAGDAFAAGFLSGLLDGRSVRDRLRLGHLAAATTLRSTTDLATLPGPEERRAALEMDDTRWRQVGPAPARTRTEGGVATR